MPPAKTEEVEKYLRGLVGAVPGSEAGAVVTPDGLMIAHVLPGHVDEELVAGTSAALVSVAERIGKELDRGDFELAMVRGSRGVMLATSAGPEAVLILLTTRDVKLGLAFLELRRIVGKIAEIV